MRVVDPDGIEYEGWQFLSEFFGVQVSDIPNGTEVPIGVYRKNVPMDRDGETWADAYFLTTKDPDGHPYADDIGDSMIDPGMWVLEREGHTMLLHPVMFERGWKAVA